MTFREHLADLKAKIKADLANACALLATAWGAFLANINAIATTLGDPDLNHQLHSLIGNTEYWGKWLLFVGILGSIARFKRLVQSPKAD